MLKKLSKKSISNMKVIDEPLKIHCSCQGGLVKISSNIPCRSKPPNKKRGKINRFSRKSKKRLIEKFLKMDKSYTEKPIFITLTYGQEFPNPREAKKHLDIFMKRIKRFSEHGGVAPYKKNERWIYPNEKQKSDISAIWRMEFQERGAPHFHIILFQSTIIQKEYIKLWWAEVIGQKYWDTSGEKLREPFTRIESIRNRNGALYYISKYIAKEDEPQVQETDNKITWEDIRENEKLLNASGFNYRTYLATKKSIGRFWGIYFKANIKYARLKEIVIINRDDVYYPFRRLARKKYKYLNLQNFGFTVYVDNSDRWFSYFLRLCDYNFEWCVT